MKTVELPLHELGVIGVTRAAAGAGVALLAADKLTPDQRRTAGWMLLALGVVTTIPLALSVIRRMHSPTA